MISEPMMNKLNEQVTNELAAEHGYLSIAGALDRMGLRVLSAHFFRQAEEERSHAMKLLNYILEVGGRVRLGAIGEPRNSYDGAEDCVKHALESEMTVTRQINGIMALAEGESDFATRSFLKYFVDEQVEEVSSMQNLLDLIRLAGPDNLLLVEDRIERGNHQSNGSPR